jgi:hypothetical protein
VCNIFAPISALLTPLLSSTVASSLQNTATSQRWYLVLLAHHVTGRGQPQAGSLPTDTFLTSNSLPPTLHPPSQSAVPRQELVISTCVPKGLGCFLQTCFCLHANTTFCLNALPAGCCSDIPFYIMISKERKVRYHQSISSFLCSSSFPSCHEVDIFCSS